MLSARRTAITNSAPDSAITYLRRALAEPPYGRLAPTSCSSRLRRVVAADPQAAAHLAGRLRGRPATTAQVSITLALGRMLPIKWPRRGFMEVLDRTRARLGPPTGARRSRWRAPPSERPSSMRKTGRCRTADRRLAGSPKKSPAFRGACRRAGSRGRERERARGHSRAARAARIGRGAETVPRGSTGRVSTMPAMRSHSRSARGGSSQFGEALADTRRLGSLPHVLGLSCCRALHHLRIGNLADAEADACVRSRPDRACPACTPPSPSPPCSRRSPSARNSRRPRRARTLPSRRAVPGDDAGRMADRGPSSSLADAARRSPSATCSLPVSSSLACTSPPRPSRRAPTPHSRTWRSAHKPKPGHWRPKRSRSPGPSRARARSG